MILSAGQTSTYTCAIAGVAGAIADGLCELATAESLAIADLVVDANEGRPTQQFKSQLLDRP
jgi:hypothetical protein